MKKVLLIGGAGYVGIPMSMHLVNNGYEVTVVDNFVYGHQVAFLTQLDNPLIHFKNIDISSDASQEKLAALTAAADHIVVLAGLVGDPITKRYPKHSESVNRRGIQNFILSLSGLDRKRVIFVSTCSNYGLMPDGVLADENSNLSPLSLYAEAKVENESLFLEIANSSDVTITILRFATAFGLSPRMRFDLTVNQFTRSLALGEKLVVFDADTWRPYCHVKDFARLVQRVFESDASIINHQVFNAGGDVNNYTKRALIDLISSKLPNVDVVYQNGGGDPRNYRVSFKKVEDLLGFVPNYTVEYGVNEIIDAVAKGFFVSDVENNLYGNYVL